MANLRSLFKLTFRVLIIAIGILVFVPMGLFFIVNPNDFKPQIQSYLTEKSGYPIQLNGDIQLKLFPWVGLTANDIVIPSHNAQEKQPLFSAKAFNLRIPLPSLLAWEFRLDSLSIEEGHFYLVKEKNGTTNWQISSRPSVEKISDKAQHSPSEKDHPLYFSISVLTLKKGEITYLDKQRDQAFYLQQVNFEGEAFERDHDSPFSGQFNFIVSELSTQKQRYTGHATLSAHIPNWSNNNHNYVFEQIKTTWDWKDISNKTSNHLKANLRLQAQLPQSIKITELNAHLNDTVLKGQITIPLTQGPINYDLSLNQLNLNPWLNTIASTDAAKIKPISYVATATHLPTLKIPSSKGILRIQHLIYEKTHAYNVVLNNTTTSTTLNITPITADLFDGKFKANVTIPFIQNTPIQISGDLNQANMQALLHNLANIDQLTGQGNINFNFSKSSQTLSGSTKINISNGSIQGLDLDYYHQMAENFIKKRATDSPKNSGSTAFESLSATFMVNYPMINNEDLIMYSNRYQTTGRGAINLSQQTIDYDVTITKTGKDGKINPSTLPLAISIKGPLHQPQIVPNLDVYLKRILEQEGKKRIDKLLNSQKNTSEPDSNSENRLEEKIEKEIERGLKKLFNF